MNPGRVELAFGLEPERSDDVSQLDIPVILPRFLGIAVHENSNRNSVTRNSAIANAGANITVRLGSAQNTIRNNTANESFIGIAVGYGDANGNTIQGNTATLNVLGIWLEADGTGNTIKGNTALTNRDWDLGDQNPGCDSNTWRNNKFSTDLVAFASDGGPRTGCIQ